jgi:hypothetical protein
MQADDARYWLLATQSTDTLWGSKMAKYVSRPYTWNYMFLQPQLRCKVNQTARISILIPG